MRMVTPAWKGDDPLEEVTKVEIWRDGDSRFTRTVIAAPGQTLRAVVRRDAATQTRPRRGAEAQCDGLDQPAQAVFDHVLHFALEGAHRAAQLGPADVAAFNADQLKAVHFAYLSNDQVKALTTDQIVALTSAVCRA